MTRAQTLEAVRRFTEAQWQTQVIDLAHVYRWEHYHPYDSRRSVPGWPDLALIRPPRLILAELKSDTGRVSPAQIETLDLLSQCDGVETYLWRPSDIEAVTAVLR